MAKNPIKINLVIPILTEIGESFDVFYGEQFDNPKPDSLPDGVAVDPETGQRYTIEDAKGVE